MTPDHFASPEFARRVGSLQTLCQGVIVAVVGITVGFWLVVWYALDGLPLMGNLIQVGGVSIVVWMAGVLTAMAMIAAPMVGRSRGRAGLVKVAGVHPEVVGSADEADRLFDVFASVVFAEYAVAGGTALALAVLFHITSLFPVVACVAALVLFLALRYPTTRRARDWLEDARRQVDIRRRPSLR